MTPLPSPVPMVYRQTGAIVEADTGEIFETTCRPTTHEVPTDTLPALPLPQGTPAPLPAPHVRATRTHAPIPTAVSTDTAVPPRSGHPPPLARLL